MRPLDTTCVADAQISNKELLRNLGKVMVSDSSECLQVAAKGARVMQNEPGVGCKQTVLTGPRGNVKKPLIS